LVGENSTGKSTFLAMLAHVSGFAFPSLRPSFNEEPFKLGTYDSIATFKGGRFGRAHEFSLGTIGVGKDKTARMIATYSSFNGQPQLSNLELSSRRGRLILQIDAETLNARMKVSPRNRHQLTLRFNLKGSPLLEAEGGGPVWPYFFRRAFYDNKQRKVSGKILREAEELFFSLFQEPRFNNKSVVALSPVRTRPKRTYDVISDEFSPEGDHIPVLLARLFKSDDISKRQRLIEALSDFGDESSLFKRISVKPLGKRPSDPFQILVSLVGPAANLLDVGYGVSQALPIVVQSIVAQQENRPFQFLLQQPEVHLHPRGQAALGSFFSRLVAHEKMEFVVETHSDYLVDRVRQEVARGNIAPSKVLILFFDKKGPETSVHEIHLDKIGNVLGAPRSYRQFFLEEEVNLLTRTTK
jgi:hypothetical protein